MHHSSITILLVQLVLVGAAAAQAGLPSAPPPPPELEAAASSSRAATAADPRGAYLALIRQLRDQGQSYAALAHVATYEGRWGADAETRLLRADALRTTGQRELAAAAYRELLDSPRAAPAQRGLALIAAERGQLREAINHFEAAVRLEPADADTLSDLGYAQLQAGRLEAARVPLMTAAELAPTNSRVLANLARYFMAAGQPARAEAVLSSPHVSERARAMLRGDAPAPATAPDAQGSRPPTLLRLEHALVVRPTSLPTPSPGVSP